ncbi:MAG: TonB-dependent receptor [Saprospiraceae bacterium]
MNQLLRTPVRGLLLLFILMLGAVSLSAQERTVRGKVTDANGEGIAGATIVQKGTATGTVADVEGNFTLTVTGADPVLVISSTGYEKQEVAVGSQSVINVLLADSAELLSELVVTGYTVETRKQTTSAVATVKTKDLAAVPTGNVEQQLQGRVSGVTVITNGQPGTTSQVRIRGFGSFFGNQPLYIVDGVFTQNIDFLTPEDIENTTVMKDASSASIYGARAAGGVIVITTKKGSKKPQKLQVSYDALAGFTTPGQGIDILNPQEQADYTWIALQNAGITPSHPQYGSGARPVLPDYINVGGQAGLTADQVDLADAISKYNINPDNGPIYQIVSANKAGTDWYDAITRTAPMTRHNLGFNGATENARYYLGLSLQEQAGILLHNNFKRYTFRANTEFDLGKRVRIGENVQFTYRQVLGLLGGGGGVNVAQDENPILGAFRMSPIIPVYDDAAKLGISKTPGYAGTAAQGFNNPRNPVAERDAVADNRSWSTGLFGNLYGEVDILSGLTFRTSIGGNLGNYYGYGFSRRQYENSENNSSFGYDEFSGSFYAWVFTNTLQYKKQFGVHNIDLLAGIESLTDGHSRGVSGSGLNPFSTDPDYITLSTVSNRVVNSFNATPWNYFSQFGRVHYSLLDKYYVTGVIRRDGSSRFGPNNRYGIFPGFSAAWRVTGENFMRGISWLDDLKIRGGWGQMGNDNGLNPSNPFSLFASSLGNAAYAIDGSNSSVAEGFYQAQVGNPDAKWEVSTTSNIGFEALLFKGKWDIIVDLWRKNTDDLLFNPPQAQVLGGFASAPFKNVASMVNKGIDVQIVNKGKFGASSGYELTLTGSVLDNEITKVAEGLDFFDVNPASNRLGTTMIRNQVGYSISAFYGYQVIGLFNENNVVPDSVQAGAGPGRFIYADVNGVDDNGNLTGRPDGKIDAADRTYIGSPVPKFTGGLNLKVTVGSFDVETYFYTSIGNKVFHLAKWFTDFYPSFKGAAISARVKDSWTPQNTDTDQPIFEDVSNFSTNTQPNSWYVEDGSFLRMQNLTIGYNLPGSLINKWKLKRARVYAATNNLFTITGYKGLDPGVGGAADTNFGIDVGNYPITRSFMFGLGITF